MMTAGGPHDHETRDDGQDRVLDHEYDGIREYDNRLPNWWQYTLYGSIVFAFLYWLLFHTYDILSLPLEHYHHEMAVAAEAQLARMAGQELNDETLMLMSTVPQRVDRGRAIFQQFCVVCHADRGQGNVGPNLTDRYWLHGGRPMDILNTVTNGVPDKGMAAWGSQLGPTRVQQVVAFVLTLRDTNVPGKEPQGELYVEEEPAPAAGPDSTEALPAPGDGEQTGTSLKKETAVEVSG